MLVIVLAGGYFILGYPLIITNLPEDLVCCNEQQFELNPLKEVDFELSHNVAYLYFSKEDIVELPANMTKQKLFKCSENELLEELKNNFHFIRSEGDMATCESKLILYHDDKLVLCTGFVLTDSIVGIQNKETGWADALKKEKLKDIFLKFKPIHKLIIKL